MSWLAQFSSAEVREMIEDACAKYEAGEIGDFELRQQLARLGLNATDISDREKQFRPGPPEDEDGT